ncbi:MAG TPA: D-glycero-beta-D-manno-heptose-7-phosphate kinase [Stellaceae bacterium]|nr:D-glycero-beta-D-manno-heptose-7-phosphate kinase [Stellaceae bacterium]
MSDSELISLVEKLPTARLLCVGDVMLDHYVHGGVERVSPEAPIPILRVERESRTLGGAGNVLRNLQALGVNPCFVSVVGNDAAGREVQHLAADGAETELHLLVEANRVTTVKTRYIAGNQQLLRADREQNGTIAPSVREDLMRLLQHAAEGRTVTVLSDYAKGVLDAGVAAAAIAAALVHKHQVVVDPKGSDYSPYRGASVLKPNRGELAAATKLPVANESEVIRAATDLIDRFELGSVLVSLSQDGMLLVEIGGAVHRLPAEAREVFDVSGAGDTAVAVLAAALGAGASLLEAARLANIAAGIVVGKVGTAVVHPSELEDALVNRDALAGQKLLPLPVALDHVARWRRSGLKIGFTNGCFDLLHPGHLSLLAQAKANCDRLVVGLNSDSSARRLKGAGRPVQSEVARAAVLASIGSVDMVVMFEQDTPLDLIAAIKPDVLVKGADYRIEEVVGAELVQAHGGKVVLAELMPGHSTTATIARLVR